MSVAIKTSGRVTIECACGARGTVAAARAAGRRLRCARCGETLRSPSEQVPALAPLPSAPAPTGGELTLSEPVARPDLAQIDAETARRMEERARRRTSSRRSARANGGRGDGGERHRRRDDGAAGARDAGMEAHLRAIAIWQRISGLLGLLGCGLLLVLGAAGGVPGGALGAALLPVLLVAAATLALGQGLWSYWAAARWVMLALQVLPILGGLHGLATLPGALKLAALLQLAWPVAVGLVLLSARTAAICTPEYRALVARTPRVSVPWPFSPFFWIPALLLGLALLVCLFLFGGTIVAVLAR
jgi:hypothetical protein